jgi:hypothetical protein
LRDVRASRFSFGTATAEPTQALLERIDLTEPDLAGAGQAWRGRAGDREIVGRLAVVASKF